MRTELEKVSYTPQTDITKYILTVYEEIINSIKSFRFGTRKTDTYGAKQNETTKSILNELEGIEGPLKMMLANFDAYFINLFLLHEEENEANEVALLRKTADELGETSKSVEDKANKYHALWKQAKISTYHDVPNSELGKAREGWKEERNHVLRLILKFFQDIKSLHDTMIPEEQRIYDESKIKYILDNRINNIVTGPYYYSFLSKEESTELAKRNKLLKQIEKSFDVNDLYIAYIVISDPSQEPDVWEASATVLSPWHVGGYVTIVAKLGDKLVDLKNARTVTTKRDITSKCYFVSDYQEFTDYYKEEESPKDTLSRKEALEKALSYYDKFVDKVIDNHVIRL